MNIVILNPIALPVKVHQSPSGQWRITDRNGRKVCAIARSAYDEQTANQIARTLNLEGP
jgi:hypothetical protein